MRCKQSILSGKKLMHSDPGKILLSIIHARPVTSSSQHPLSFLSIVLTQYLSAVLWVLVHPLVCGGESDRHFYWDFFCVRPVCTTHLKNAAVAAAFPLEHARWLNARRSRQPQPSPFSAIVQLSPFQIRTLSMTDFLGKRHFSYPDLCGIWVCFASWMAFWCFLEISKMMWLQKDGSTIDWDMLQVTTTRIIDYEEAL